MSRNKSYEPTAYEPTAYGPPAYEPTAYEPTACGPTAYEPTAYVPRPCNAFFQFLKEKNIRGFEASRLWNGLSDEERGQYYRKAEIERHDHRVKNPTYRYKPKRKNVKLTNFIKKKTRAYTKKQIQVQVQKVQKKTPMKKSKKNFNTANHVSRYPQLQFASIAKANVDSCKFDPYLTETDEEMEPFVACTPEACASEACTPDYFVACTPDYFVACTPEACALEACESEDYCLEDCVSKPCTPEDCELEDCASEAGTPEPCTPEPCAFDFFLLEELNMHSTFYEHKQVDVDLKDLIKKANATQEPMFCAGLAYAMTQKNLAERQVADEVAVEISKDVEENFVEDFIENLVEVNVMRESSMFYA